MHITGSDLISLGRISGLDHHTLVFQWKQAICKAINLEAGRRIGFAYKDDEMALVEAAEIEGFKEQNMIQSLLSRISLKSLPIDVKKQGISNQSELLRRASQEFDNRKSWILVDDIDSTFTNSDEQKARTSSFFSACRALARDIRGLRIRASVRSDVWASLRENEDLDKCDQYISDIRWTPEQLKDMLSKRVHSYCLRKHCWYTDRYSWLHDKDLWLDLIFAARMPWGNKSVEAMVPIRILSGGRPRWVMQLCRLAAKDAAKQGGAKISKWNIDNIMKNYGERRIANLYREHKHQFVDLQRLIESFANGSKSYSTAELLMRINKMYVWIVRKENIPTCDGYPFNDALQLAHLLYKVGFLAAKKKFPNVNEPEFISYEQRPELLANTINRDDGRVWQILPPYQAYLSIHKKH